MYWLYLDTSTFVKLYVRESGSEEARSLVKKGRILSSTILILESFSALSRKKRIREIDGKIFKNLVVQIKADLEYITIIRLSEEVLKKAESIALYSEARALDAIHVASAMIFKEGSNTRLSFVTSDRKQQQVANSQGIDTFFVG